jgi:hypothetical protein
MNQRHPHENNMFSANQNITSVLWSQTFIAVFILPFSPASVFSHLNPNSLPALAF